jgi:hypothetical protein
MTGGAGCQVGANVCSGGGLRVPESTRVGPSGRVPESTRVGPSGQVGFGEERAAAVGNQRCGKVLDLPCDLWYNVVVNIAVYLCGGFAPHESLSVGRQISMEN